MKIIGVSQRLGISKFGELRAQIDTRLFNFISKCGYVPIPIPYYDLPKKNSLRKLSIWLRSIKLSGIVLSGGDDIGKYKLRDNSEKFLINYSIKKKIPVFGICRGMQVIGSYFKVKLKPVKNHANILQDYASYMKGVKKATNIAVKEFEMKKAAFQWQRATTGKTGILDVNSLHAYKSHDDIFKRVTSLANAKNHGMIMLIDYSGSMASTMSQVLDQLIHLVTFCKNSFFNYFH